MKKKTTISDETAKRALKERILNFKAESPLSFGDAAAWERKQREDRELPFSQTEGTNSESK